MRTDTIPSPVLQLVPLLSDGQLWAPRGARGFLG